MFLEVPRLKWDKNNGNIVRFNMVGGLPLPWVTLFLYEDIKLQGAWRIKICVMFCNYQSVRFNITEDLNFINTAVNPLNLASLGSPVK